MNLSRITEAWRRSAALVMMAGVAVTGAAVVLLPAPVEGRSLADPAASTAAGAQPWVLRGWVTVPSAYANQGVTTVVDHAGRARVVTRGNASVLPALRRQGWVHVGDPDSASGYLLDPYQGRPGMRAKLFLLTSPNGRRTSWPHRLGPTEMINNSFAAIAPGGQWFVSGEWGTITRLLVFATPQLNPRAPAAGHNLPLAAVVVLSRPMRNVQGCAFSGTTTLVCSTDDPRTDLYGVAKQLLSVRLSRPLDGHRAAAETTLLGPVPQRSRCPGRGETEGLGIHGSRLLLTVVAPAPCQASTLLYTYTRGGVGSATPAP